MTNHARLLNATLSLALMTGLAQATLAAPKAATGDDALYKKECGACHTPFPAYFLPASSWDKIMGTLDKHFGESATLSADDQAALKKYLAAHAADNKSDRRGDRVMASLGGKEAPLRVTEVKYFISLHHEVPKKVFVNNPKLKSFSDCGACHPGAAAGNFDEDDVKIPGTKNWERD